MAAMRIRWSQTAELYEFDTGDLFGTINPFGHYHGVNGLMHRANPINLVKAGKSFLNAEYYTRSGEKQSMMPRQLSRERRTTHEMIDNAVAIHFPPEDEFGLDLTLRYTFSEQAVDMQATLTPREDMPGFDLFFASYICEALRQTWVPLRDDGWTLLDNRNTHNGIFAVMRATSLLGCVEATYPDADVTEQQQPFAKPILVARDPASGLTLAFICDANVPYIAGQCHGWDTAHDWAFAFDLKAGQSASARAGA